MSVTLRDVARVANVSISTASRALAGGGPASDTTRAHLVRVAAELGYRPNTFARGLKTRNSRLVGMMVHNLVNASFCKLAEIVQTRLRARGYQVILCITSDDPQQERDTLVALTDQCIDGLIVVPTGSNGSQLQAMEQAGIPVVSVIRRDETLTLETVLAADPDGAYVGTRYLTGLGHRRIGLVVGRPETTSGRERLAGFRRGLDEAAIKFDPALVYAGRFAPETGIAACRAFLALPDPVTAIFVANHEASLGVLRTVAERGLAIPDELSLLCYEDTPWFEWHRPALSVVDSGAAELANIAVDRLLQRLDGGASSGREYRVGARLVERASCRAMTEV
jgi:LacI family transcriptional regulator